LIGIHRNSYIQFEANRALIPADLILSLVLLGKNKQFSPQKKIAAYDKTFKRD